MGNAGNSVVDSMNFLCGEPLTSYLIENGHESYAAYSAGKTAQEMCATGSSVVQYLTDTSCKLNSTLDSVEDFIDGLSDIVSALDNITGAIGLLETGVNAMEIAAQSVDFQCGTLCSRILLSQCQHHSLIFSKTTQVRISILRFRM
jgi:hypothetical protein